MQPSLFTEALTGQPVTGDQAPGPDDDLASLAARLALPREAPDAAVEPQLVGSEGRFRRTADGLDWACDRCQSWNALEVLICSVCGRSFREQLTGAVDLGRPATDPSRVRNLSLLLPGLGHMVVGDTVNGVARMIVALLWLVGGVALLQEAGSAGQSPLPAVPLLLGAMALWTATYLDATNLAAGSRHQVLDAKRFLWLFIGVMSATVIMFFPGFLAASS